MSIRELRSVEELKSFMNDYSVPDDWHEPDNSGIDARIIGSHLDNAMGDTMTLEHESFGEYNVVFTFEGDDVAVINLATLLHYATRN